MTLHIYSHNPNSEGAAELAAALGVRRIRRDNSRYVGNPNKTVINWGASAVPANVAASRILNNPNNVAVVTNKLKFFNLTNETDIRVPEFTNVYSEASDWARAGTKLVCRSVLNGHSGEGITISNNLHEFVDIPRCPLYTKYVKKAAEYRVHFANGVVIDVQRKIRDPDREPTTFDVRSHANGFIFVRNGVADTVPTDVTTQANLTIQRCGLDFGAIDIIYNNSQQRAYVLEVNTAPGLTGETVNSYANAFRQYL